MNPIRIFMGFLASLRRARTYADLLRMSDADLAAIGVRRDEITRNFLSEIQAEDRTAKVARAPEATPEGFPA